MSAIFPATVRAGAGTNTAAPVTARELYNAGTQLLAAKKYPEAEKMFQGALTAQDDAVQPRALYNVGYERFTSGLERLKKGPDAQKLGDQGNAALATGDRALHQAESALAGGEVDRMVAAYLAGRGARHELKDAEKAVSEAMQVYGKTLEEWLRAADDFKGAAELNPRDTNAAHNAEIVDRGIARLVDTVRKMQSMMGQMGQQRQDLGKMMKKLKGKIPGPDAPPGPGGEDEDDDQGVKPDSLAGQKESVSRQTEEMHFVPSPEQAAEMLNGLMLDSTRRLEMSDKEGAPAKDRKGKNW